MRRWIPPLSTGFFLVLVVLAWVLLLPIQFGGSAAYVVVNGQSMEPVYHKGDLVIVRRVDGYAVGDIVTYYNEKLSRYVIHRIVAVQNKEFTLKGDNNSWLDQEKPTIDQIVGRAWLHIPALGDWLAPIRTPLGLALLAGAFAIIAVFALSPSKSKIFHRRRPMRASGNSFYGGAAMKGLARQLETTILILSVIFVLFLALGIVAFSRDEYLSENVTAQYIQLGRFSYSAASQPGVYDSGSANTGDPIFLKTSCQVKLSFNYSVMSDSVADVTGNITLRAQAEALNGWKRSFPLAAKTSFSGSEAVTQAEINPCEILAALREVESKTELRRDVYSFVIIPEVNLNATVAGQPVTSTFTPRLVFYLDEFQLYILRENPEEDPLLPIKVDEVVTNRRSPNVIHLPGFTLTVGLARILSGLGLLSVLVVSIFLGVSLSQSMRQDPLTGILVKYGALLVEVESLPSGKVSRTAQVASIDDLARVAERGGVVIMHVAGAEADEFAVELEDSVYHYSLPKGGENVPS